MSTIERDETPPVPFERKDLVKLIPRLDSTDFETAWKDVTGYAQHHLAYPVLTGSLVMSTHPTYGPKSAIDLCVRFWTYCITNKRHFSPK